MSDNRNTNTTMPDKADSTRRAILILSLSALFFFYKYILQNFPSVMAPELMSAFDLQGLGLGVLSGVYFWTYLIVPLFVGILLDYCGVRWITTAAIFCCAIGVFVFSQTLHLNTAILGRTLMGVGVSFATITYFKLASVWFDTKHYALLTSILVAIGMLGAVCGQMPLAWLIHQAGWRTSLTNLGWAGIGLAILFALFVKERSTPITVDDGTGHHKPQDSRNLWQDIQLIVRNKQNWLLTGYGGLAFAPVIVFCGLWGNPFLQKAYQLDSLTAPFLISLVFIGLAVASPLFALISKFISNRCTFMFYSTLVSAACILLVIFAHPMPIWVLGCLLFFFGFSLGAFPMVFVIGKEINPLYLAGTAISLINASDAFFDAITEPLIGKILDYFGQVGSSQEFSITGYHIALAILPLYQIIGAFLLRYVKDEPYVQKKR